MADLTYDLFTADQRRIEVQNRLTTLEQQHYVLKLNEKSGIDMPATNGVAMAGGPGMVPVAYSTPADPADPTSADTARQEQINKLETAITELRKELKAIEDEIKAATGS